MSTPPANSSHIRSMDDELQSLYRHCHVQYSPASTLTGSLDSSPSGSPPPAAVPSSVTTSDHVPGSRPEDRSSLSTKPVDTLPLVGRSTAVDAGPVAASSLDGLDRSLAESGPSFGPTVEPDTLQESLVSPSEPAVSPRTHVLPVVTNPFPAVPGRASRTLSREQLSPPLAELGPSSSVAHYPVPLSMIVSPDTRQIHREMEYLSRDGSGI